jgi:glycosyltransferase involved in cell wall biosynthesis
LFGGFDSVAFDEEIRSMIAARDDAAVAAGPITLHGRFESAQLHAAGMHVGVFPSICLETYGQVLDECFELGLPCILTSSGALAERSAGAGLLVDAGCVTSLAAAMLRMIDEPELWHQLRARLPRKSIDRQAHAEAVMGVYERVLREPQRVTNVEPVPMERRLAYLQMQRDSALGRACGGAGPR